MKILVTGTAGFIGFHLSRCLLQRGDEVTGIDNINDYYDVTLKYGRLRELGIDEEEIRHGGFTRSSRYPAFRFMKTDITDHGQLEQVFASGNFEVVCHLAAQAGVRYSLSNPKAYLQANITGFLHVLECCRQYHISHLVYASSSSIYGLNEMMPFCVHDGASHPVSLYAASKKSNELMAHTYSHLFNIPTSGLRFFTVYGPWGRPDMALYSFTKAILEHEPIEIYNNGQMKRDFTYIDDIIDGVLRVVDHPAQINTGWDARHPDPASSTAPYKIYNIGRGEPVSLLDFIREIEINTGSLARRKYLPLQSGDVVETWADIMEMKKLGYHPRISVAEGVRDFVNWYRNFYILCS